MTRLRHGETTEALPQRSNPMFTEEEVTGGATRHAVPNSMHMRRASTESNTIVATDAGTNKATATASAANANKERPFGVYDVLAIAATEINKSFQGFVEKADNFLSPAVADPEIAKIAAGGMDSLGNIGNSAVWFHPQFGPAHVASPTSQLQKTIVPPAVPARQGAGASSPRREGRVHPTQQEHRDPPETQRQSTLRIDAQTSEIDRNGHRADKQPTARRLLTDKEGSLRSSSPSKSVRKESPRGSSPERRQARNGISVPEPTQSSTAQNKSKPLIRGSGRQSWGRGRAKDNISSSSTNNNNNNNNSNKGGKNGNIGNKVGVLLRSARSISRTRSGMFRFGGGRSNGKSNMSNHGDEARDDVNHDDSLSHPSSPNPEHLDQLLMAQSNRSFRSGTTTIKTEQTFGTPLANRNIHVADGKWNDYGKSSTKITRDQERKMKKLLGLPCDSRDECDDSASNKVVPSNARGKHRRMANANESKGRSDRHSSHSSNNHEASTVETKSKKSAKKRLFRLPRWSKQPASDEKDSSSEHAAKSRRSNTNSRQKASPKIGPSTPASTSTSKQLPPRHKTNHQKQQQHRNRKRIHGAAKVYETVADAMADMSLPSDSTNSQSTGKQHDAQNQTQVRHSAQHASSTEFADTNGDANTRPLSIKHQQQHSGRTGKVRNGLSTMNDLVDARLGQSIAESRDPDDSIMPSARIGNRNIRLEAKGDYRRTKKGQEHQRQLIELGTLTISDSEGDADDSTYRSSLWSPEMSTMYGSVDGNEHGNRAWQEINRAAMILSRFFGHGGPVQSIVASLGSKGNHGGDQNGTDHSVTNRRNSSTRSIGKGTDAESVASNDVRLALQTFRQHSHRLDVKPTYLYAAVRDNPAMLQEEGLDFENDDRDATVGSMDSTLHSMEENNVTMADEYIDKYVDAFENLFQSVRDDIKALRGKPIFSRTSRMHKNVIITSSKELMEKSMFRVPAGAVCTSPSNHIASE